MGNGYIKAKYLLVGIIHCTVGYCVIVSNNAECLLGKCVLAVILARVSCRSSLNLLIQVKSTPGIINNTSCMFIY